MLREKLGAGTYTSSESPHEVARGLQFSSIGAGGFSDAPPIERSVGHHCGVTTSSVAYCRGSNERGQLGIGPLPHRVNSPTKVVGQP